MTSPIDVSIVRENVQRIREHITRHGGSNVSLVAVTKTLSRQAWAVAKECGCDAVGENYAQELRDKCGEEQEPSLAIPVHFIGAIQTNKVRLIADVVDLWQSVDRESILKEIAKRSGRDAHVLIQVNTTGEEAKSGCAPTEIEHLCRLADQLDITVKGLMTMGPTDEDPVRTRAAFTLLRKLTTDYGLDECSMGMSGDYLMAVDEGSTMVRIGQAIFGPRTR